MASRLDEGMPMATVQEEIPTVLPLAPPPDCHVPEMRGQGVHAKALRIRAFWSEIGRTPGCPACETPGPGKSHTRECKTHQDAWDESSRTASAEEAKRGVVADPDTRPLDLSGSSMDLEPKRTKTTSVTDNEHLADRMDEDNFQRTPATSHPLEPVDDENVSKKARVARNCLHIRGEDSVKFDVNEEAWPNADLVIRASCEGALIDGLPANKVKAGDEREIQQMKDLQLYSRVKETDIPPDNLADQMDATAKTNMVICDPSYADPAKTKVIGKVIRYTNTLRAPISRPAEQGLQIGRFWPDHHGQETTGTQERHLRDDGVVGTLCHFQGQVHHYCEHRRRDSCSLPGIRVPKCTRWRPERIHSETYRQVRGRMLGLFNCRTQRQ